jgi:hypothetical protein
MITGGLGIRTEKLGLSLFTVPSSKGAEVFTTRVRPHTLDNFSEGNFNQLKTKNLPSYFPFSNQTPHFFFNFSLKKQKNKTKK